ncbi:hypothetical protein CQ046_15720 [Chryseobacterium sp. MYb7]|uniref:hypothetical protein n=1 Tax=Chryseobacterium sp. MYb7 TaxID=1827290 RepID=UPI000CFE9D16|nr:hypothetical protein [Chryseobacterium sp. MYb7]PRB01326.1 hypothetical protein CQ046_15720 [Chryseobacterium sp. MYb7]
MITQKKVFQNIIAVFLPLLLGSLFVSVTSCKSNEDEIEQKIAHKWYYKVEASEGAAITIISYANHVSGETKNISINGISGTTWTSGEFSETSIAVPRKHKWAIPMHIKAKANGTDISSTLKVQIYVDGVLVKEVKDIGLIPSAEARYEFNGNFKKRKGIQKIGEVLKKIKLNNTSIIKK